MSFYKVETNGIIQGRRGNSQRGSGGGFELYNNSVLKNKFNPTKESTPYHDVVKGRPSFQPGTGETLPLSGKSIPSLRSMFPARTKWNEFDFPRSSYVTKKVMTRGEYLNVAFEMGFKADSLTQAVDLGDKTLDTLFGKKKEVWELDANGVLRSTGKMERPNSIKNILESSKSVNKKLSALTNLIKDKDSLTDKDKAFLGTKLSYVLKEVSKSQVKENSKFLKEIKEFNKNVGRMDKKMFRIPDVVTKKYLLKNLGVVSLYLTNNALYGDNDTEELRRLTVNKPYISKDSGRPAKLSTLLRSVVKSSTVLDLKLFRVRVIESDEDDEDDEDDDVIVPPSELPSALDDPESSSDEDAGSVYIGESEEGEV